MREAAALMRERAEGATNGGFGWRLTDLPGANEVWAPRDAANYDAFMVASTSTRLNPNPGLTGHDDAVHIATFASPPFALTVAAWLDAAADWREENPDDPDPDLVDPALAAADAYLGTRP